MPALRILDPVLRLYDRPTSGNAYKARLLLAFLGLAYETIPVGLERGRNIVDDDYRRLNPRGQIPTLDDDGWVLWGSTAILVYLAHRYDPPHRWLPADAHHAGRTMQWLELAQNEIATGLFLARAIRRFGYTGDPAAAQRDGETALRILEGELQRQVWLGGDNATIADIACFPYAALAAEGGFDLAACPAVQRWIADFKRLDGFVTMPGITSA